MATASTMLKDEKYNYEDEESRLDAIESTGKVPSQPVIAYKSRATSVVSVIGDREVFSHRCGVAVDYQTGNIYVSEYSNSIVQVLDCNGQCLYKFEEKMNGPCSIAISQNRVFVTQYLSHCVLVYDLNGTLITQLGGICCGVFQFLYPHGITISKTNGDIYVCDYLNHRIQTFSKEFPGIFQFGQGILKSPCDIQLSKELIYVLSNYEPFIYSFTCDFTQTHNTALDSFCKHLESPLAFCIDGSGHFIISDWGQEAIVILNQHGELVHKITDGVQHPLGIILDSSKGRIIVVGDNNGLLIF